MAEVRLTAEVRAPSGKGAARRLRAEGKIPAVVYGRGIDTTAIQVDRRELVTALHTEAGSNVLLDLRIDGKSTLALTRELQRDPVKGTLLHADFIKVDRTQSVEVEVPIHIVGTSPGVAEGGVLEHPLFQVQVKCLPTEVPEFVPADVSGLGIGDSLRLSDLTASRRFEIIGDPETVVASVVAPVSEEELEAMEAAAAIEATGGVEPVAAEEVPAEEESPEGEPAAPESDEAAEER